MTTIFKKIILGSIAPLVLLALVAFFGLGPWESTPHAATTAKQIDFLIAGLLGTDGKVLSSGKVYTYEAGSSTTAKATYTAADKSATSVNPIILDAYGRATVYGDGNYRFIIKDRNGVTVSYSYLDNLNYVIPSSTNKAVTSMTASYVVTTSDGVILANTAAGNLTATLPTAVGNAGLEYTFVKTSADSYTLIIDGLGSETISGATTYTLRTQYQNCTIISDGTNWQIETSNSAFQNIANGFMIDGKIVTSVATSDLTVAIKTMAGNDPTPSEPVYICINGTTRIINTALSIILVDATNWFAAGSTDLATQEIDYFAYLGWRASTSTVFLGFARIPYGALYSDFSATSTNAKYLAYSGAAPAATDIVENVGRFNSTLSAGAGYTWSAPTTSYVVSRPTFNTRTLSWLPTLTGFSGSPSMSAWYNINNRMISYNVNFIGTSNATGFTFTFPFSISVGSYGISLVTDNSTNAVGVVLSSLATFTVYPGPTLGTWTNSGTKALVNFQYSIPLD